MNYLELVKRLAQEAGVTDANITSTSGLTGELKRCADWVSDAYREIQGLRMYSFLWEQKTLTLAPGSAVIVDNVPAMRYDRDSMWLLMPGSNSPRNLDYLDWAIFRDTFQTMNDPGNVTAWTVQPNNVIKFNAVALPAQPLSPVVDRYGMPQVISIDEDVPRMPDDLHMLIVWTAMKKYAGYDEAGTQRQIAVDEMQDMERALNLRCLPTMGFYGPLEGSD